MSNITLPRYGCGPFRAHVVRLLLMATLVTVAILLLSKTPSHALAKAGETGEIATAFQAASRHWGVPVQLLMAIGYVESHWEQRGGEPSLDGGYGIMHLVGGPKGTLQRAATLFGLSMDALEKDGPANIEGGAAVLSDISHKLGLTTEKNNTLSAWYASVAEYSGAPDMSVRDGYAREVFLVISTGRTQKLSTGEVVTLPAEAVSGLPIQGSAPNSDDYPPALWVPANSNNYSVGREYGPLNFIVIHDTEGSYASAISWFQNPSSGVSAHYVVRSQDGEITQMVRNANTAYHAGNWDYNVRAFGIEHEGFMNQQGWYTEPMYQASSALARTLADNNGIYKDRAHIIGHVEVPGSNHHDPGPYWDWTHYMSLVRRDWLSAAQVDNTDSGFAPVPSQIDPAHYWWTYGGGYNGSNTYATTSVTDIQYSVNSATWTAQLQDAGYYDIYAFIPWVDNQTADTSSAQYKIYAGDGLKSVTVSQKAITDVGSGSWAHLGKYYFNGGGANAQVSLSDLTGETGRNVWFDAMMWIPTTGGPPPTPATSTPVETATPRPSSTARPTNTVRPTNTRSRTATPPPTETSTNTPMPSDTPTPAPTWTPGPCDMRFTDLPDTHWSYQYVAFLFCRSIIGGYPDGTFHPNSDSTRAQLSKMITIAMGWDLYNPIYPDFSDVAPDSTYYKYVETAYLHYVFGGYSDGTFRPNNPVTRAQAAKMFVGAAGWPLQSPVTPSFSDVPRDHWSFGYVESAASHGIIGGYGDGSFHPNALVTRAQVSKMLALMLQYARKK